MRKKKLLQSYLCSNNLIIPGKDPIKGWRNGAIQSIAV